MRGFNRKSKNRKIDKEERRLVNFLKEKGWGIFNGNMRGVGDGEYTFTREGKYGNRLYNGR